MQGKERADEWAIRGLARAFAIVIKDGEVREIQIDLGLEEMDDPSAGVTQTPVTKAVDGLTGGAKKNLCFSISGVFSRFFVVFWAQLAAKSPFWGVSTGGMGCSGGGGGARVIGCHEPVTLFFFALLADFGNTSLCFSFFLYQQSRESNLMLTIGTSVPIFALLASAGVPGISNF